jgi:histone-lysine N-methyltransferase SETMAR
LDHPPYRPDLTPSDFHLFLHLKKHLAGKKFDDDDDLQGEVIAWFKGLLWLGDREAGSKT